MEEWVGHQWHRWVSGQAARGAGPAVALAGLRPAATALLHAGGAPQRVAEAAPVAVGGGRGFWQRLAGAGTRAPLAQLDAEVLALPGQASAYPDAALNRELLLWLAALAAGHQQVNGGDWVAANLAATTRTLLMFPGLAPRWARLREAELARRAALPPPADAQAQAAEATLCRALRDGMAPALPLNPRALAPVWCWLLPVASTASAAAACEATPGAGASAPGGAQRRRGRDAAALPQRNPLLLAHKGESLRCFADPLALDRGHDDANDGSAAVAAQDLETLALQRGAPPLAARVRFDLDLPSASADDLVLASGERLPEWDHRAACLRPARVAVQLLAARAGAPGADWVPAPALRASAARIRRRLALQQAAPRWRRNAADGEQFDLDAWVRHLGEGGAQSAEPAVYQQRRRGARELATLLLADLSLSTEAHANNTQRVIDVVREALYVFGEALAGSGDAFAMLGFSSVRRQLRLQHLKGFDEPWPGLVLPRLGALKPGHYTRMGAALRAATTRLAQRPERQRLLLLLTDGKPHDLDGYEGRAGLEDTRQAVLEARRAGLLPLALTIDESPGEVLPRLFGPQGWAWVRRPGQLPQRLAALYAQLVR